MTFHFVKNQGNRRVEVHQNTGRNLNQDHCEYKNRASSLLHESLIIKILYILDSGGQNPGKNFFLNFRYDLSRINICLYLDLRHLLYPTNTTELPTIESFSFEFETSGQLACKYIPIC
jgi:hypothetical protein